MLSRLIGVISLASFLLLAVYSLEERETGYTPQERKALSDLIDRTHEKKVVLLHELYGGAYE